MQHDETGFFILLVKIFGLYSAVVSIFSGLPSYMILAMQGDVPIQQYFFLVVGISVAVGLFWLLTFKADKLVDLLKLEKGLSDDRIDFGNISIEDITRIGVFVIGGMLVIENIPRVLSELYWTLRGDIVGLEFAKQDKIRLSISGLNVAVGYLLFSNADRVAKLVNKRKRES